VRLNRRVASVALAIALAAFSIEGKTAVSEDPGKQLDVIAQQVRDGAVTRIEILALPNKIMTRTSITPQALRESGEVVPLRNLTKIRESLVTALRKTKAVAFDGNSDLRRGVVFYSHRTEVFSFYYDKFAHGEVNGKRAKFSGALISWVNSHISPEYR
jgi:hypothetical protein